MKSSTALAAVAAAMTMVVGVANAATFDFSAGDPGSGNYTYNPTVPDAVFYGNSGLENLAGPWGFTNPPDNGLVAFVQNNPNQWSTAGLGVAGELTVTFNGLTAGGHYDLSFYVESRPNYGGLSFTANGVAVATPTTSAWTLITTPFVASGGSQSISFVLDVVNPGADNSIGLNQIAVNSAAAPEPATWALLMAGFAGLGFAGYRRAKAGAAIA